jgi:hypothetical protein
MSTDKKVTARIEPRLRIQSPPVSGPTDCGRFAFRADAFSTHDAP